MYPTLNFSIPCLSLLQFSSSHLPLSTIRSALAFFFYFLSFFFFSGVVVHPPLPFLNFVGGGVVQPPLPSCLDGGVVDPPLPPRAGGQKLAHYPTTILPSLSHELGQDIECPKVLVTS